MRNFLRLLIVVGLLLAGFIYWERKFLDSLERSVIYDDKRLAEFLKTLSYPIETTPIIGFCRVGGSSRGYTYQYCVTRDIGSPSCPSGSLTLLYLEPRSKLSFVSREFHDIEPKYRVEILNFDEDGTVCNWRRKSENG